ncbi:MAG: Iron-sulfur cluster insertion protein ErpA [Alphaproteobacteria bacterium MarineAlpha6_Bin6]|nr:iron-sulfur cluster assembly accessory protein [Pelagibacteraceae bacterium]PPR32210.1 MAG: Iron-sulfur cluster insertion protein ErpA [Alphaproteobacteria bacterium MarineAlpha6_Bin6]PPR33299.1 MAG: Iron-sulfur cluster insertion protein ErpA [Alphaproteobacteria bacterium MarineAlpha6_Bin5]|tara:strand:- start:2479 stop:2802 length:324 start_codon:yes stop_codon:yes gene_type:complete
MNNLLVTSNAAKKIIELSKKKEKKMLRISVTGGGCQGFQYNLDMEDKYEKKDIIIKKNNALVVIDKNSLDLIKGSEIDFVEDLIGSRFKINNPKATSSCGCGTSFSL